MEVLLGPPEDVSVLGAGQAHSGGVHDGHQVLYVLHQHPVEQPLIPLLDPHQVDVSGGEEKYHIQLLNGNNHDKGADE